MATPKYRQNTATFTYYNRNPKKLKSSSDCVARAISGATGIAWDIVVRELTKLGITLARISNEKETYDKWLQGKGWKKQAQPRKWNDKKYTITEFCKLYPKGTFILGIANHLTFVEDGKLYDTWNCERKTVGNFWVSPFNK